MTATIVTGHFDKPVKLAPSKETLSREQQDELRILAKAWNTTLAGAVLKIVSIYLDAGERP